jgi:hypothetical protein
VEECFLELQLGVSIADKTRHKIRENMKVRHLGAVWLTVHDAMCRRRGDEAEEAATLPKCTKLLHYQHCSEESITFDFILMLAKYRNVKYVTLYGSCWILVSG